MFVLGIDVGTTGTKALLVDEKGNIAGRGYKGYGLITGAGGVVEQDPRDWWQATVYAVREAAKDLPDKSRIAALALSTQGASSLLLDDKNEPLCNAITWMDTRAKEEKQKLEAIDGGGAIYRKTGWRLNESLDAAKLLWLKDRHASFAKAKSFVSTIEYMHIKLSGENIVDPTNAAIRQLMNLSSQEWDKDILGFIGVSPGMLPVIRPSGAFVGTLAAPAAEALGLCKDTRVYVGAHDQYCASLGAGAAKEGEMALSTGTAWVTLGVTKEAMFTKSCLSPARHIVPGLWGALASIPAGGAALDWFKAVLKTDYADINANIASRMQSAGDVFFYPYFFGARFPAWKHNAKAAFTGLSLEHDRYDMLRAVMEGVAFQVKLSIDEYAKNGAAIDTLRLSGGAAKSAVWTDIIAAVTGLEIHVSGETDSSCIGAAAIAGVGAGIFRDYGEAVSVLCRSGRTVRSDDSAESFYRDKFAAYIKAWEAITGLYT